MKSVCAFEKFKLKINTFMKSPFFIHLFYLVDPSFVNLMRAKITSDDSINPTSLSAFF